MRNILAVLALALASLLAMPATAQEAADPHARLIETVQGNADTEAILATILEETDRQFRMQPQFAAIEAQSPGTIAEVVKAMGPAMRIYQTRVQEKFRPQFIAVSRDIFSDEEATQLADFYGSQLGQRLLQAVSENYAVGNTLEGMANVDEEFVVDEEEVRRDRDLTLARTMGSLSAEEIAAIDEALAGIDAVGRMPQFQQRTVAVQVLMENEPPTPEEEQMIEAAIAKVFKERFE